MLTIDIKEKYYSSKIVLQNLKIQINNNGLYGVIGKNGSGKTTFFNCINHLTDFEGKITFQGGKLLPQQVAFLPTEPFLYEHLTVQEFYTFFRKLINVKKIHPPVFEIDTSFLIKELSTGMRKKVYFNALLQKNYDIYIFDEPFNGLDIESVYQVKKLLVKLAENHIVFVSSHVLETLENCNRIFFLQNHSFKEFFTNEMEKIRLLFNPV